MSSKSVSLGQLLESKTKANHHILEKSNNSKEIILPVTEVWKLYLLVNNLFHL